MNPKLFRQDMAKAIRKTIAHLDPGTVGIGRDCLWQITVRNIPTANGPTGTNAGYIARQVFDEIVSQKPYAGFVY